MTKQYKDKLSSDPSKSKCSNDIIRAPFQGNWPFWFSRGQWKFSILGNSCVLRKLGHLVIISLSSFICVVGWFYSQVDSDMVAKMTTGSFWLARSLQLVTPGNKDYLYPNNFKEFLGIILIGLPWVKWHLPNKLLGQSKQMLSWTAWVMWSPCHGTPCNIYKYISISIYITCKYISPIIYIYISNIYISPII